ncbi:hypothetical protein ACFP1Z_11860 [Streptomyces gamaensis]|uniref:Uncharacterized protein n=1 Tax=Streptomyces gamaensis TaxID=1763542 RepID=A0ABW0YZC5_9ACTN
MPAVLDVASSTLINNVPYITAWSGELPIKTAVITTRRGIAYPRETIYDRDEHGVLWSAYGLRQGRGKPDFGKIHPQRQRRAMGALRCQVCGSPAGETQAGALWLLDREGVEGEFPSEGEVTTHPPVCAPCAGKAVTLCPTLRREHSLVRVKKPTIAGVHGVLHKPGYPYAVAGDKAYVSYDDPKVRWVLAGQLYAKLYGITPVSRKELAAVKSERLTLQQRLYASVAGVSFEVMHLDGDHQATLPQLNADTIRATIDTVLNSEPGPDLDLDNLAKAVQDLKGHLGLLMPMVAGVHPELVASVGRRLQYEPPDAHRYPACARQWAEESARTARQLLALACADEMTEQRHAGVEEGPGALAPGREARPHPPVDHASG